MNVIEGLNLSGFQLDVAENFNSIQGLRSYYNSFYRKEFDVSSNISLWGDISPQNNNLGNKVISQRPNFISPYINIGQNKNFRSPIRNFNFLHNGSPFGIYSIVKVDLSLFSSAFTIIDTSVGSFTGMSMICGSSNNGRIVLTVNNGATIVRQVLLTNILNEHPAEALVIVRHVFKGVGVPNNHILSYGNASIITTSSPTGYDANGHNTFFATTNPTLNSLKFGALLLYDFTGLTSGQIDTNDVVVLNLLNVLKNELLDNE